MSANTKRESWSDKIRKSVVAQTRSTNAPPVVFREQKRPNFIVPKSPVASSGREDARNGSRTTPTESFPRKPRFITTPSAIANSNQNHNSPRRPAFILPQKRVQETDIAHAEGDFAEPAAHNPFNVSDELEEPSVIPTPSGMHMSKRIMTTAPGSGRLLSSKTQTGRPTSEVLSSLKFGDRGAGSRSASPAVQTSADWSPHKRRGKATAAALERDKFMPGGMAETVALWIYESQSQSRSVNREEANKR